MIRRAAVPLVGLAVSLLALTVAVQGIDLARAAEILRGVGPGLLVVIALVLVIQLLVRSVRWSLLLPLIPVGRVSPVRLIPIVLIGYLGNAVLPARLGDPIRALLASRREAVSGSGALGSVVLERVLDTLTLALIVFPAAMLAGGPAWLTQTAALASVLAGAVFVVAQTSVPPSILALLRSRLARPGWVTWLDRSDRFFAAMNARGRGRLVAGAAGLSVVAWLLDGTIYWLAGAALGINLSPAGAMLVSAITVLGTAIPSAPGYVGTFELAASAVARALGVDPDAALALAILAHAMTVVPLAIGGAASLVWIGVRFGDLVSSAGRRSWAAPEVKSEAAP